MITGVTAEGPNTYAYGVFGTVTGKGIDEHPHLRFAADPVSLAEHVPNLFDPPVTPDVFEVEVHGANPYMPGVHPILANHPKPLDPNEYVSGTITITLVDRMTVDHAGHAMHGRIDIVDGGWDLHGEFAIAGCDFLDVQYP